MSDADAVTTRCAICSRWRRSMRSRARSARSSTRISPPATDCRRELGGLRDARDRSQRRSRRAPCRRSARLHPRAAHVARDRGSRGTSFRCGRARMTARSTYRPRRTRHRGAPVVAAGSRRPRSSRHRRDLPRRESAGSVIDDVRPTSCSCATARGARASPRGPEGDRRGLTGPGVRVIDAAPRTRASRSPHVLGPAHESLDLRRVQPAGHRCRAYVSALARHARSEEGERGDVRSRSERLRDRARDVRARAGCARRDRGHERARGRLRRSPRPLPFSWVRQRRPTSAVQRLSTGPSRPRRCSFCVHRSNPEIPT